MSDPCFLPPAPPFLLGDAARVSVTIAGPDGAHTDPISLTLRTLSPQGVATTLRYPDDAAIVRDALGAYHADVLLTQPGTWYWRWQSGHPSIGVAEGRITVQPSRFTPE